MAAAQDFQDLARPARMPAPVPACVPVLVLRGRCAVFAGPSFALGPHRLSMHCLAMALHGGFSLALPPGAPARLRRIAPIGAGLAHHLITDGAMAFVYADRPITPPATAAQGWALVAHGLRLCAADADPAERIAAARVMFETLKLGPQEGLPVALARALAVMARAPLACVSAAKVAQQLGLRGQGFQRGLKRHTGLSYRQHVLRARIQHVLHGVARGASLTAAAHDAGFSSSAHLSATFRAMFGLSASRVLRAGTRILIDDGSDVGITDGVGDQASGAPRGLRRAAPGFSGGSGASR